MFLLFTGTIHIHAISKILMSKGSSSCVLDFLIWACVSMESSVPLLTVKYLGWRTQLYTTTCLCFYDLKADEAAENFAKRGLVKVISFFLLGNCLIEFKILSFQNFVKNCLCKSLFLVLKLSYA